MTFYSRREFPDHPGTTPDRYVNLPLSRQENRPDADEPVSYSDLLWHMLTLLLTGPDEEWTAPALAAQCAADAQNDPTNLEAVDSAIRELMADQWVEPVPFQQLLTVRLTSTGRTQLPGLLMSWSAQAAHSTVRSSASDEERRRS